MKTLRSAIAVTMALAVLAQAGHAQSRVLEHRGFWLRFGLGYGSVDLTCDGCQSSREGGVAGFLALGGTLGPHWQLGGETSSWVKSEEGITLTIGTATLSGYYYPSLKNGLYLRAGAGLSYSIATDGSASETHTGVGGILGLGYDIPVSRKVAISPYASWSLGSLGTDAPVGTLHQNTLQVGLGVTFE